ncbi:hypothetical protein RRG08_017099 [Elysia crispata]|uniref:Uncharacterized protein n=1 Tax=Elysia crispata TaxID=231223 RepID=A0AAE1DJA4_9GAST|nr:hypothetical protein RRG08_017099 [Elysia crispata]
MSLLEVGRDSNFTAVTLFTALRQNVITALSVQSTRGSKTVKVNFPKNQMTELRCCPAAPTWAAASDGTDSTASAATTATKCCPRSQISN